MNKSHSKLSKNEPVCICEESWCLGLGQEGGCLREGRGNCLKYLKRWWNRKKGRGNKISKRWDKLGQGVGALKMGARTPLWTM